MGDMFNFISGDYEVPKPPQFYKNDNDNIANINQIFANISENMKKSISGLNDLNKVMNRRLDGTNVNSSNQNNDSYISTYELDIKNIADVSQWEDDDVKPIKIILSVAIDSETPKSVIKESEEISSLYSLKFFVKDMIFLMEDGTFKIGD